MPGTLFVVATPIGNLEDVTARALRILREVAVIAAEDTRRTAHLLSRYAITTPTTSLHAHNEAKKAAALVGRLLAGDDVAVVSDAGTPAVSDPGEHLIRSAIAAGIRVEAVPGPSAVLAALAASGLPSSTFVFLGFPPIRSKDRKRWFDSVGAAGRTVVFFEAPHRILSTLRELKERVGDCTVAVGRELTKSHEELVRGPISTVLSVLKTPIGEYTVVADIGHLPNHAPAGPAGQPDWLAEFYQLTKHERLSRRAAISTLAKRHGISSRAVYQSVEAAKSVEAATKRAES